MSKINKAIGGAWSGFVAGASAYAINVSKWDVSAVSQTVGAGVAAAVFAFIAVYIASKNAA